MFISSISFQHLLQQRKGWYNACLRLSCTSSSSHGLSDEVMERMTAAMQGSSTSGTLKP